METPLIIERVVNAAPKKVWETLTNASSIKKWFIDIPEFKAEPGFEFTFEASAKEGKTFRHLCSVIEAVPNKKLSYSWRYDGYPGNSTVTFELFEDGERTKLRLTHAGLETFPQTPDFVRQNFMEGWTAITGALQALLEKQ